MTYEKAHSDLDDAVAAVVATDDEPGVVVEWVLSVAVSTATDDNIYTKVMVYGGPMTLPSYRYLGLLQHGRLNVEATIRGES